MRLVSSHVDLRIKKCGALLYKRIIERKSVIINQIADTSAEVKRFSRWLRNKEVTPRRLIDTEKSRIKELTTGLHVLGVQDTTELNYEAKKGRAHGLGTVGNGKDIGFFMHPLIVLNANTGVVIGCAEVELWNRTKKADEHYELLPIESKESYRWISTAMGAMRALSEASCVTHISDRESDIYEYFDRIPDTKTHLIARTCRDRIIKNSSYKKLYEHLEHTEEAGRTTIELPREIRKNRNKRIATLSIKHSKVDIAQPKKCTDKSAPETVTLYVVEAKEVDCPEGEKPIHWRLFTTHVVNNFDDATQIISWYRMRWNIEQVFRTMKSQGFKIEDSQVEFSDDLMKLAVLALCSAVQIMQLVSAREGTTDLKTQELFTGIEQMFMKAVLTTVEGKTQKQKNPYPRENMAWASWIIARLGGWHCYTKSGGLPGPIIMGRGLKRFYEMFDGWNLYRNVSAE